MSGVKTWRDMHRKQKWMWNTHWLKELQRLLFWLHQCLLESVGNNLHNHHGACCFHGGWWALHNPAWSWLCEKPRLSTCRFEAWELPDLAISCSGFASRGVPKLYLGAKTIFLFGGIFCREYVWMFASSMWSIWVCLEILDIPTSFEPSYAKGLERQECPT